MVVEQDEQDIAGRTKLPDLAALSQDKQPAAAPGAVILDVRNVSIWYGSFKAVTDVSLTIYEREITAFIGSSGSGKTTVLPAWDIRSGRNGPAVCAVTGSVVRQTWSPPSSSSAMRRTASQWWHCREHRRAARTGIQVLHQMQRGVSNRRSGGVRPTDRTPPEQEIFSRGSARIQLQPLVEPQPSQT
jgi:ABC-type glutathione transport system ATPase component